MTLYTETANGRILNIDLFHGTSSLFLDSIIKYGLGSVNPLEDLDVYNFSNEVYTLSVKHLKDVIIPNRLLNILGQMVSQENTSYQHGSTYVSPSLKVACRYTAGNKYGSELLTYSMCFLEELIRHSVVTEDFRKKYQKIFNITNVNPTPILIKISNININNLLDEHGNDPTHHLNELSENFTHWDGDMDSFQVDSMQTNFRLTQPVALTNFKVYLINVKKAYDNMYRSPFNLYEIQTDHFEEYSLP